MKDHVRAIYDFAYLIKFKSISQNFKYNKDKNNQGA